MEKRIFINRRKGRDRRLEEDPCEGLDVDIYHRKRRKNPDRRSESRSIEEDYQAFLESGGLDDPQAFEQASDKRYH